MLIIGLNGSPNKEDNTAALLSAALEPAREKGLKLLSFMLLRL